jgi:DNA-binding transcriptional ArsR family regulator
VRLDRSEWPNPTLNGHGARHHAVSIVGLDIVLLLANYKNMNLVFKALSDPTRRRILQLLRERPMTAGQIAEHFDIAKPTLSAHFAVLRKADLVESEKAGTTVTYSLKVSVLEDALLSFAETVGVGVSSGGKLKLATRRSR